MRKAGADAAFDFRGSMFTLPALNLRTHDLGALRRALKEKCEQAPAFFGGAPVVIELGGLDDAEALDFAGLGAVLRECGMVPVGVREADKSQYDAIREAGFAVMQGVAKPERKPPAEAPAAPPVSDSAAPAPAKVINGAVRSGQVVHSDGGDLIVMGAVNEGAEVIADGHVHIYGPLRGRARAGARGDASAMIFALSLEPQSVAIGDEFLPIEELDPALRGRPGRVSLRDGRLMMQPL